MLRWRVEGRAVFVSKAMSDSLCGFITEPIFIISELIYVLFCEARLNIWYKLGFTVPVETSA